MNYVVGTAEITYVGPDGSRKVAAAGDTVTDLPADSMWWLLLGGHVLTPEQVQVPNTVEEVIASSPPPPPPPLPPSSPPPPPSPVSETPPPPPPVTEVETDPIAVADAMVTDLAPSTPPTPPAEGA
jgi:hypothetical protein